MKYQVNKKMHVLPMITTSGNQLPQETWRLMLKLKKEKCKILAENVATHV